MIQVKIDGSVVGVRELYNISGNRWICPRCHGVVQHAHEKELDEIPLLSFSYFHLFEATYEVLFITCRRVWPSFVSKKIGLENPPQRVRCLACLDHAAMLWQSGVTRVRENSYQGNSRRFETKHVNGVIPCLMS